MIWRPRVGQRVRLRYRRDVAPLMPCHGLAGRGDLHSGSAFDATARFGAEEAETIRQAVAEGIRPLFRVILGEGAAE